MIPAKHSARLVLEDGSVWRGQAFGAPGTRLGEVVFNTSLTGYQEILTDPSYAGQIVVMTAPQIGNTGINTEDDEARQAFLSGFIVRDLSPRVSNWRAHGIRSTTGWPSRTASAISGIDTRALTRRLRDRGSCKGVLTTDPRSVRRRSDRSGARVARSGWDRYGAGGKCAAPYAWDQRPMQHGNSGILPLDFQPVGDDVAVRVLRSHASDRDRGVRFLSRRRLRFRDQAEHSAAAGARPAAG